MTRAGERDRSGSVRAAGSVASEWTGFTDPSRATDRRRRDSRHLDRRMRGRRESVGTLATIERPTPNVRRIERRRSDLAKSGKPQGRTPPTLRLAHRSAGGRRNAEAGSSGGRPPRTATRLTCAVGDQTSGEVPDRQPKDPVGPVVTGSSVVLTSADCFGAAGRSRARTPRRRRIQSQGDVAGRRENG